MTSSKHQFVGQKVRLGELIKKAKIEHCGNRSFPVYSMTMHNGIVKQSGRFKKMVASQNQSAYKIVRKDQLVVGFPIDEGVIYVQNFEQPGIMSPAYNIWDFDKSRILPGYLELALHSPQSMAYYADKMRGTTARRRTLTAEGLRSMLIPLPSIERQGEIVEVLSGIKKQILLAQKRIDGLDSLVKSRFVEMFGDIEPEESVTFKECCSAIQGGKTPSMKHPEYYGGDVPFVKSGDVKQDTVSGGALFLTGKAIAKAGVKLIPKDSILVVTRSAMLHRKMHTAISACDLAINQDIKAFVPSPGYLPSYLLWAIRSHEQELLAGVRSVSTCALDFDQLCSIRVPNSPIREQESFSAFVTQVDKSRFAGAKIGTKSAKNYAENYAVHNKYGCIPGKVLHGAKEVAEYTLLKLQELYDSLTRKYFAL